MWEGDDAYSLREWRPSECLETAGGGLNKHSDQNNFLIEIKFKVACVCGADNP